MFEALRGEGAQKARILALRDGSGVREPKGRKRGRNKGKKKQQNKIHKTFFLLSLSCSASSYFQVYSSNSAQKCCRYLLALVFSRTYRSAAGGTQPPGLTYAMYVIRQVTCSRVRTPLAGAATVVETSSMMLASTRTHLS